MRAKSALALAGVLVLSSQATLLADGTESLGPPSIPIETGSGIASAGTGMISQPGSMTVEVPAGATVNQVLLYWEGFMILNVPGDDTISVSTGGPSTNVTGTLIGGPTRFFGNAHASTFRADITALGLIGDGSTSVQLSSMNYTRANNGAGLLVIYDDGTGDGSIDIRDGSDLAFQNFAEPLKNTVAQTYGFPAAGADRTAIVDLFFASVSGSASGGTIRPTAIEVTTAGGGSSTTTVLDNLLNSISGDEFDQFTVSVDVPAGATSVTVQPFSRDDLNTGLLPASFDWIAGAFSLEPDVPTSLPGRMTGGGSVFTIDGVRVTRGFQIHCDLRDPNNLEVNWPGGNRFHLTQLTAASCTDDPAIGQAPPKSAPFDTFTASGVGLFRGDPGARIEFVFVDAGEPGTRDTASIKVWDINDVLVLDVPGSPLLPGYLDRGNIQAHKDNQSTL